MATTSAGLAIATTGAPNFRPMGTTWCLRATPTGMTEDALASRLKRSRSTNSKWCSSASVRTASTLLMLGTIGMNGARIERPRWQWARHGEHPGSGSVRASLTDL